MSTSKLQTTVWRIQKASITPNFERLFERHFWLLPTPATREETTLILLLTQQGKWRTASAAPSSTEKEMRKCTIWARVGAGRDTAAKSNTFQMLEQSTILNTNEPCWFYDLHNEVYQGITSRRHLIYKYSTKAFKELWQYEVNTRY